MLHTAGYFIDSVLMSRSERGHGPRPTGACQHLPRMNKSWWPERRNQMRGPGACIFSRTSLITQTAANCVAAFAHGVSCWNGRLASRTYKPSRCVDGLRPPTYLVPTNQQSGKLALKLPLSLNMGIFGILDRRGLILVAGKAWARVLAIVSTAKNPSTLCAQASKPWRASR